MRVLPAGAAIGAVSALGAGAVFAAVLALGAVVLGAVVVPAAPVCAKAEAETARAAMKASENAVFIVCSISVFCLPSRHGVTMLKRA